MSRHAKKLRDHDINPCLAETDATTKCMNDNNYNKDMCTDYFLKYKNCRRFWVSRVNFLNFTPCFALCMLLLTCSFLNPSNLVNGVFMVIYQPR
uniref:Coiled-coil-helix-coiled-coil-helix domain-containing protein 7 n=1 Tax=Serinus canaria TaxID=9135 RepID=A0A8C9NIE3_SERCA